jgi:hypothetical protein
MGMKKRKIFRTIEKLGEIPFIIFGIILLPLWFPALVLWVVLDPSYRFTIWVSRLSVAEGERTVSKRCDITTR